MTLHMLNCIEWNMRHQTSSGFRINISRFCFVRISQTKQQVNAIDINTHSHIERINSLCWKIPTWLMTSYSSLLTKVYLPYTIISIMATYQRRHLWLNELLIMSPVYFYTNPIIVNLPVQWWRQKKNGWPVDSFMVLHFLSNPKINLWVSQINLINLKDSSIYHDRRSSFINVASRRMRKFD